MKRTEEIIRIPNLPEGRVTVAVSAMPIPGVSCIRPPSVARLSTSMRCHADLQLCHLEGAYFLAAPEVHAYYKNALSPYGITVLKGEHHLGSTYPSDATYNIARVGDVVFHNPKFTDPVALRFYAAHATAVVPIGQGYAKCAVVPVDKKACITADRGVARAAEKKGLDVLEIAPGGVELPGFPYGFLGGAVGKISGDTLFVTGSLSAHPSYMEISAFLQKRGIKIEEGSIPIPIDIGSVIPVLEIKNET